MKPFAQKFPGVISQRHSFVSQYAGLMNNLLRSVSTQALVFLSPSLDSGPQGTLSSPKLQYLVLFSRVKRRRSIYTNDPMEGHYDTEYSREIVN